MFGNIDRKFLASFTDEASKLSFAVGTIFVAMLTESSVNEVLLRGSVEVTAAACALRDAHCYLAEEYDQ